MKLILQLITVMLWLLTSISSNAQMGEVKESGYKIPVGMAVQKIVPGTWKVMFVDNTLRNYQITWDRGERWTSVLDQVGMQYDIAFVADSQARVLYVSDTQDLRTRGITLIGSPDEALNVKLSELALAADDAESELQFTVNSVKESSNQLIKIEQQIYDSVDQFQQESSFLASSQAKAVAYGQPVNKQITMDLMAQDQAYEVELHIATSDKAENLIMAGELYESLSSYFESKWNYTTVLSADSLPVVVTLPHNLRMPGTSMEDDINSFSKAINNKKNSVNIFFRVLLGQSQVPSFDGEIILTIARKRIAEKG
jgi:hypothetical protein